MNTRFIIRRAALADLPGLITLEHQVFTGDRLNARQYRRHILSKSAQVLVAKNSNNLLGMALIFFRRGLAVARLYSIAVAPAARGHGLGQVLLQAAERVARTRGCARMRLEVRQDNTAAIALYEREGYRKFGIHTSYYEDGMAAWRYEKRFKATGK